MPVALLVGGLVAAVGLLRLGWVSEFLSTPAVTGVLAGISVQIVVHQLPAVLGVPGGGTTTVGRVRAVASQLGTMHAAAAVIAVAVLLVVVLAQRADHRFPGALLGGWWARSCACRFSGCVSTAKACWERCGVGSRRWGCTAPAGPTSVT